MPAIEAVALEASNILVAIPNSTLTEQTVLDRVPDLFATIPWTDVGAAVATAVAVEFARDSAVERSVRRLARSITDALARHRWACGASPPGRSPWGCLGYSPRHGKACGRRGRDIAAPLEVADHVDRACTYPIIVIALSGCRRSAAV